MAKVVAGPGPLPGRHFERGGVSERRFLVVLVHRRHEFHPRHRQQRCHALLDAGCFVGQPSAAEALVAELAPIANTAPQPPGSAESCGAGAVDDVASAYASPSWLCWRSVFRP